jgi:hypothetical protein
MSFAKLKAAVLYLLQQKDANSRFIFLLHGVAITAGTLALVTAFICAKDKASYPSMVMALGGSGGIGALGRWATKKTSAADAPPDAVVPDATAPDVTKA